MNWFRSAAQAVILTVILLATGVFITPVFGYQMESDSWRIQQDSINFGGGLGTSGNYNEEDTMGEVGTGYSGSANFNLHAGYQQMDQETWISLTVDTASTTLEPPIPGMTGGTASGTEHLGVATNNPIGYSLEIAASTSPALQADSSTTFLDYASAGSDPDYDWMVASTSAGFGFTPEGPDIVQRFLDNGADTCNYPSGVDTPGKCWDKFTTDALLLSQSNAADESFVTTTLDLKAEVGPNYIQPSGAYHGHFTITAFTN